MALLTPTTELEAVNALLEAIEEERVHTLLDATDPDVIAAQETLARVSRTIQTPGWEFNTETDYAMARDPNGTISVPSNLVSIKASGYRLAVRNRQLYDRSARSYSFSSNITAEVIFLLAFEELPELARVAITLAAIFEFQARRAPDELTAKLTAKDVTNAMDEMRAEDILAWGASMSGIPDIDNRARS